MADNFERLGKSELVSSKANDSGSNLISDAWSWASQHKVETAAVVVGTAAVAFGGSRLLGGLFKGAEETGANLSSSFTSSAFERTLAQSAPGAASRLATSFTTEAVETAAGRIALTGGESMESAAARSLASRLSGAAGGDVLKAAEGKLAAGVEGPAEKAISETADAAAARLGLKTSVVGGDIAKVKADAVVSPINSFGDWRGGLDGVIYRNAGEQFHAQAAAAMPLVEGQTVIAAKTLEHKAAFDNVVFVVDDLNKPLREVVLSGLKAAEAAGYKTVSLPAMRTGVMLGAVEKTLQQTVDEMAAGVKAFRALGPKSLKDINFVVYNNDELLAKLTAALKK